MVTRSVRAVVVLVVCLGSAMPAFAQDPSLSSLLVRLLQERVILAPPAPGSAINHSAHFVPGADQQLAPFLFNQALVAQLSRIPLGSSSGGFTFRFDPAAGTFTRSTPTFGPSFAERAVTIGKGKVGFGFSFQRATYDGFEGLDLRDGDVKFYLTHVPFSTPPAFFEGDVIEEALRLNLSTNTSTLFGSYGVTDRLEVAVAIPIVNVKLDAAVDARVLRLSTALNQDIHRFPSGSANETFTDSGSASGIGDLLIRSKYVLTNWEGGGLAGAFDLRLPTGDENDLLGTGAVQATVMFIGSRPVGRFAPHFNVGYTFSGESDNPFASIGDEFLYTAGTEIEATPRLTLNADLLGRVLRDSGRLREADKSFRFQTPEGTFSTQTFQELSAEPGSLKLATGSVGVKFNLTGTMIISANVLFPLTTAGIYDKVTPILGIDYVF